MSRHDITSALLGVRTRIDELARRHGRDPASVRLVAVSKTKPASAVREAYEAGQRAFGENQLQDAQAKVDALAGLGIEWHFIGPVQSNKTRPIAADFAWVHTIDRLKVARRLNDQRPADAQPLQVCVQVNVSGETSKSGVEPDETVALAEAVAALPRLRLRGLMAIPAPESEFSAQRAPFRKLRALLDTLNHRGLALDTLSMGMTQDTEAAIAEGATIVRIGTAIFGARSTPARQ
jgi:pyridoxal phosphate enzyme (YggS family)